jgi:hypothetical protein
MPVRNWGQLIAWIAFLVIVALLVLQVSIAGVFRTTAPQIALAWVPDDAQARGRLAGALVGQQASPEAKEAARDLARDAIRRDPLNVVALRAAALATDSAAPADRDRASKLIAQAERLSRRDFPVQMWLIEDRLRRNDFAGAMDHFDVALRTSKASEEVLIPLIVNASTDPRMAQVIEASLTDDPLWREPFMSYLVMYGPDTDRAASLALKFLDPKDQEERVVLTRFLERLAGSGEFEQAQNIYTRLKLGPALARDGVADGFERAEGVAPFTWALVEEGDLWAYREAAPEGDGQVLRMAASSGRSGEVARQLVALAPGTYRVEVAMGDVPDDAFERPRLIVRCASDEDVALLTLRPSSAGTDRQQLQGRLTIPAGCRFQWIAFAVAGDGPPSDVVPWADDLRITR